jgi:hypothetical protein
VKDLRVVVAKTDVYGEDVNDLYYNGDFMTIARNKLIEEMNNVIEDNMYHLKKVI